MKTIPLEISNSPFYFVADGGGIADMPKVYLMLDLENGILFFNSDECSFQAHVTKKEGQILIKIMEKMKKI